MNIAVYKPATFAKPTMTVAQRLPNPYRPEAEVVAHRLQHLHQALDWASAAAGNNDVLNRIITWNRFCS